MGFIGMGKQSDHLLRAFLGQPGVQVVAVCDVDKTRMEHAAKKVAEHYAAQKTEGWKGCMQTGDFREVLARKDIDAVCIATPDHWHAIITVAALKAGKDVYCEKPLTHNIHEAVTVMAAVESEKRVLQTGSMQRSSGEFRVACELVRNGVIGKLVRAEVQFGPPPLPCNLPEEAMEPGLDWDLWLGPAPERKFNNVYFPGPKWYRWWDFGSGTMSDLGSHWNDLPFWALKLDAPQFIEASAGPAHPELAPATMTATYEYGARGDMPACKLTWHQGEVKPQLWTDKKIPQWGEGCLFIGDKGMLLADYNKHVLLPEEQFKDFTPPEPTIPDSIGHHKEWLHACKTGAPTTCNFAYSGALTEANHLGNVAYRVGKRIAWDPVKLECPGTPEAAKFLRREYRKGWDLAVI